MCIRNFLHRLMLLMDQNLCDIKYVDFTLFDTSLNCKILWTSFEGFFSIKLMNYYHKSC